MKYEILARFEDDGGMKGCGWRECGTALEAVMEELREAPADTREATEISASGDDYVAVAYRFDEGVEVHVHQDGHDDYRFIRDAERELVVNQYGRILDYEAACMFMDGEIRERLHCEMVPCKPQEFFDAYCKAYEEEYGEPFFLAEQNPTW